ncbi:hypothetical protein EBZ80_06675, partial [bacterium]|nr:hypothetical protein [bacterium]
MRVLALLGGLAVASAAALRGAAETWRYTAANQSLFLNQEKIVVRGITWRGLDTEIMAPLGLWRHSIEFYLDTLRSHGFNAVRLVLDEDWVVHKTHIPAFPCQVIWEPEGSSLDILDAVMDKTRRKQMYVVLSMERGGETAWDVILNRYGAYRNLLG